MILQQREHAKACEGGPRLDEGDMVSCLYCGREIRWDLADHPFWGFQNCDERQPRAVQASNGAARRRTGDE
jgi:hypothetical protein